MPREVGNSKINGASTQALRVLYATKKTTITGLLVELRTQVIGGDGAMSDFPYYDHEWTRERLLDVLSNAGAMLPGGTVDLQVLKDAVVDEFGTKSREKKQEAEKSSRKVETLYAQGLTPKEIQRETGLGINRIRGWVGRMRRGSMYLK